MPKAYITIEKENAALRQHLSSAEDRIQLQREKIAETIKERDEAREVLDKTYYLLFDIRMEPTRRLSKAQDVLFEFCIPHRPSKASEPPRTGEQTEQEKIDMHNRVDSITVMEVAFRLLRHLHGNMKLDISDRTNCIMAANSLYEVGQRLCKDFGDNPYAPIEPPRTAGEPPVPASEVYVHHGVCAPNVAQEKPRTAGEHCTCSAAEWKRAWTYCPYCGKPRTAGEQKGTK
jgi:hypothetical protein